MSDAAGEWRVARPHPALRHVVRKYIGYRQDDVTLGTHRGLPSGSLTLVVSLAEPIRVLGGPGTEHGPRRTEAMVGGLHLTPALIGQDRHQHGVHIELNPLGVHALLGVAAAELVSDIVDVRDLPVRWAPGLAARLADCADWTGRFSLLDKEFLAGLRPVTLAGEVRWAWGSLRTSTGGAPVAGLAQEVGWSRRHLASRFAAETGVSPKQAGRLIRFEHSQTLIRAGRTLAEVASTAGFYDQAHLTNEWRSFAGCTPGAWIDQEFPFLQYPDGEPGTDSMA